MEFHPAQDRIASDTHRYRVVVCGRRFGKTTLSVWEMLAFAWSREKSKVVYLAPTIKQARDIAWRMLKEATRTVSEANETRLELSLTNGSEIWLRGTENVESLRGQGIDFLVVDEVASIKNWNETWEEVLRPTLTDTRGQVLFIGTPKGYNHFYDLYMKPHEDTDYISFKFTSYDNPFIPSDELEKAKDEMDEDAFRQEYMAEFRRFVGMVYKEWDMDKQFMPIEYDPKLPLHLAFDFGVNDPTAIIWIQRMGGEFRAIDYFESSDASVDRFISIINGRPYHPISGAFGDPAGEARSITTNTSPIDEYRRHGIHIKVKPGVTIEEQVRITHKYIPSLFVSDKLPRLRDCILGYRYPEKRDSLINQSNEIPIHDEYSHAMRALEYYFVNQETGVQSSNISKFAKVDLFDKRGILK
jgi:hypothetical protein